MIPTAFWNYLLDAGLHGGSQISQWYVGLIAYSSTVALAAADTMSSHSGWTEVTGYSESTRQEWLEGAASGASTTNSVQVAVTINTAGLAVYGYFLASNSTKGGTTGTLGPMRPFNTVRYPTVGQVMKFTITGKGVTS